MYTRLSACTNLLCVYTRKSQCTISDIECTLRACTRPLRACRRPLRAKYTKKIRPYIMHSAFSVHFSVPCVHARVHCVHVGVHCVQGTPKRSDRMRSTRLSACILVYPACMHASIACMSASTPCTIYGSNLLRVQDSEFTPLRVMHSGFICGPKPPVKNEPKYVKFRQIFVKLYKFTNLQTELYAYISETRYTNSRFIYVQ